MSRSGAFGRLLGSERSEYRNDLHKLRVQGVLWDLERVQVMGALSRSGCDPVLLKGGGAPPDRVS